MYGQNMIHGTSSEFEATAIFDAFTGGNAAMPLFSNFSETDYFIDNIFNHVMFWHMTGIYSQDIPVMHCQHNVFLLYIP